MIPAVLTRGVALAALLLALAPTPARPWGLETHRRVNDAAIDSLPLPLRRAFEVNRQRIVDLAVEPDTVLRERFGRVEAVRHFIDLDLYGAPPFRELPRAFDAAVSRFGRQVVTERGTLPWTILRLERRLVRDLKKGDWDGALRTAGLVGHYVADASMPLHTTDNHDGQRTGNDGIHKRIEHALVDARIDRYFERLAGRIEAPRPDRLTTDRVFALLLESYAAIPPLLRADRDARREGAPGSLPHLDALDRALGDLLAARLAVAVRTLGSLWLSAWEAAGRPALPAEPAIDSPVPSPYDSKRLDG